MSTVPLAKLNLVYRRSDARRSRGSDTTGRVVLWATGLILAAAIYFGTNAFFAWKHPIASSGGRYFIHRVLIPVPAFSQDDPRWTFDLLGPTYETMGQSGCAVTSTAMVLAAYGVDTDPKRLNAFLATHDGYTPQGWLFWEKAAAIAPLGQVEKVYEDPPSYALIDQNLLKGNPVIVRMTLRNGETHFVVIVGKEGWNYLIQDPARTADWGVYPLRELTSKIEALRYFRVVPPRPGFVEPPATPVAAAESTPAVSPAAPLAPATQVGAGPATVAPAAAPKPVAGTP
jgi:hypothetical protein